MDRERMACQGRCVHVEMPMYPPGEARVYRWGSAVGRTKMAKVQRMCVNLRSEPTNSSNLCVTATLVNRRCGGMCVLDNGESAGCAGVVGQGDVHFHPRSLSLTLSIPPSLPCPSNMLTYYYSHLHPVSPTHPISPSARHHTIP